MPTPYQQKYIDHILKIYDMGQVEFANWAAREFQRLDPYQLNDLVNMVKTALQERKKLQNI